MKRSDPALETIVAVMLIVIGISVVGKVLSIILGK
jgi:hypothetical protein